MRMLLVLIAHMASDWDYALVSKKWWSSMLGKGVRVGAGCVIGVCSVECAGAVCPVAPLFFYVCTW